MSDTEGLLVGKNLYQILEIEPQASDKEIKAAYFRLVRQYTPEKEPEKFRVLRNAYETLKDPKSRSNYDAMLLNGEEIKKLDEEANSYIEDENWTAAISVLKRILAFAPNLDSVWHSLGLCYLYNKSLDQAEETFIKLIKIAHDVPLYWSNYGFVYKEKALSTGNNILFHMARECFRTAINLEPFNPSHYINIALTYTLEDNYSSAQVWLDRAINCDEKTDMDDLEAFIVRCMVYVKSEDFSKINNVILEIKNIPDATEEFIRYAAKRFISLSFEYFKNGIYFGALAMLEGAQFLSYSKDKEEVIEYLKLVANSMQEFNKLADDNSVIEPVKRYAALNISSLIEDQHNYREIFYDIVWSLTEFNGQDTLNSIYILENRYKWISRINPKSLCTFKDYANLTKECSNLQQNPTVIEPIKEACLYLYFLSLGRSDDHKFKHILNSLNRCSAADLNQSAILVKNKYKAIYELNPKFFDEIIKSTLRYNYQNGSKNSYSSPNSNQYTTASGSGCVLPIISMLILLVVILISLF